jgi:hypothetical protein
MVGAEMPMSSDQVIWSEQNRLHIAYDGCTIATNTTITVPLEADKNCAVRAGSTIVISADLVTLKGRVKSVSAVAVGPPRVCTLTIDTYKVANMASINGKTNAKIFVYGSEFGKGTQGMEAANAAISGGVGNDQLVTAITPDFTQFSNKPIIIMKIILKWQWLKLRKKDLVLH